MVRLNAATRLRAYSSELEERAFDFARNNYSLERGDIRFRVIKQDAVRDGDFTEAEVENHDFYYGVSRAMSDMLSELRSMGHRHGEFIQ